MQRDSWLLCKRLKKYHGRRVRHGGTSFNGRHVQLIHMYLRTCAQYMRTYIVQATVSQAFFLSVAPFNSKKKLGLLATSTGPSAAHVSVLIVAWREGERGDPSSTGLRWLQRRSTVQPASIRKQGANRSRFEQPCTQTKAQVRVKGASHVDSIRVVGNVPSLHAPCQCSRGKRCLWRLQPCAWA